MQEIVTTSDIRKNVTLLNRAKEADLIVTKLDKPRFVVISYEKYKSIEDCLKKLHLEKQEKSQKLINKKSKNGYQTTLF